MYSNWHHLIPKNTPEKSGIIINALQRYLQFDTFAGVIPAGAIDKLFTEERLSLLIQQAVIFYRSYHRELDTLSQNVREEMLRAHLCGIIKLPIPSEDQWRTSFSALHKQNRTIYDRLSTIGRVELILQHHQDAKAIAAAVDKHLSPETPLYTPLQLITTTLLALEFYTQHKENLQQYPLTKQCQIISDQLSDR
ncbi:MAG: hypothetical protein U9Q62_06475 [Campylobacterota bacterium]|nr:hypothetical protein [Campylobacterota bacterium]